MRCDVLVVGGGLGGVAAALTAARLGLRVVLSEETDWLGGQLTAQAVPPDEHPWIERYASASYRRLRTAIRDYYRRNYPLLPGRASDPLLNPGLGVVSPLCHEPRVAVAAIDEMLAPYRTGGSLTVLLRHRAVAAVSCGDQVEAVTLRRLCDGAELSVEADYVVDATELGDLLELAEVEHVIGAESVTQTGEPHAAPRADPLDQQAITWCFPLEHRPGENHVIDRPAGFGHWRGTVPAGWPGPQLSWTDVDPVGLTSRQRALFDATPHDATPHDAARHAAARHAATRHDLWHYRRIIAGSQFTAGPINHDITLVNWPQIDYRTLPLLGVDPGTADRALREARQLSLSLLYWMQTQAPRPDGGTGYPGLRLRPDIVDTTDGLAKTPYIRESRRIRAEFTVLEQHLAVAARPTNTGSQRFTDSVGIGSYRIDLHPSTAGRGYLDIDCYPFQIPLGALLPQRVDNLLPANKNIGTTHITNGCYRLHPVEWSIGEAVGALVAQALAANLPPRKIRADATRLTELQHLLHNTLGVPLAWPEHLRTTPRGQGAPHASPLPVAGRPPRARSVRHETDPDTARRGNQPAATRTPNTTHPPVPRTGPTTP